jgi:ABC-2 type transport system permease protein
VVLSQRLPAQELSALVASSLKARRFRGANWVGMASLFRRQMKSGLSDLNYTLLGPVVSNVLYLLLFAISAATLTQLPPQEVLEFIAPGLICFMIAERAYEAAGANLIFEKHQRAHLDWIMAPLTPIERTLCFACSSTACGAIVGFAVALATLFFVPPSAAHPWAILVFGLGTGMFHGLAGTVLGIWAEKWDQYTAIHTFVLLPLAFPSGIFSPVTTMPEVVQTIMHANPIFYMIDGFRYGVTGVAFAQPAHSIAVLAVSIAVLALWTHRWLTSGYRLKA